MRVDYPVAVDNDYAIWRAFNNHYWPALYFVDAQGRIRHHQFGEGDYEQSEMVIQQLLAEAGASRRRRDDRCRSMPQRSRSRRRLGQPEVAGELCRLRAHRELCVARRRGAGQAAHLCSCPRGCALNQWALSGDWTVRSDATALNKPNGRIAYRFHARDLHLVMGPAAPGASVRFRVLIDGQPPGAAHGSDVDEQGNGTVTEQRLYQLIRQPKPIADRQFEIEFLDPGVEAFAFTFG